VVGKKCPDYRVTSQCPKNPISFVKHDLDDTAYTASKKQGTPICGYLNEHGVSVGQEKWSLAPQHWFGVSESDLDSDGKVPPAVYSKGG
jgi:hypothetical protein